MYKRMIFSILTFSLSGHVLGRPTAGAPAYECGVTDSDTSAFLAQAPDDFLPAASDHCLERLTRDYLREWPSLGEPVLEILLDSHIERLLLDPRLVGVEQHLDSLQQVFEWYGGLRKLTDYMFDGRDEPGPPHYQYYVNHSVTWVSLAVAVRQLETDQLQDLSILVEHGMVGEYPGASLLQYLNRARRFELENHLVVGALQSSNKGTVRAARRYLRLKNDPDVVALLAEVVEDNAHVRDGTVASVRGIMEQKPLEPAVPALEVLVSMKHESALYALRQLSDTITEPTWNQVIMMARAYKGDGDARHIAYEFAEHEDLELRRWAQRTIKRNDW